MCRHLGRCGAAAIMEDDIYVLVSCWKWALPSESFHPPCLFFVALFVYYAAAGGAAGLNLAICGTASYLKKSQYLHASNNSSVPPKTTFGDEAYNILSACWQKSREMVYEGPSWRQPSETSTLSPNGLFGFISPACRRCCRRCCCHAHALFNLHLNAFSLLFCVLRRRWSAASVDEVDTKRKERTGEKNVWNERRDLAGKSMETKNTLR